MASASNERETSQEVAFLERQRRAHDAVAQSRRRVYVEQTELLERLDVFASTSASDVRDRAIVVTGESGSGKSSLLANWSLRLRSRRPDAFIIEHYIGAASGSSTHFELIRRIVSEIRSRYDLSDELPGSREALEEELPTWFAKVQREDLFIVVDALNELDVTSQSLTWLPAYLQPRIRIVTSATPSHALDVLIGRGWVVLTVDPLSPSARSEIVGRYLASHHLGLTSTQLHRVSESGPTTNPLFLRTSLEELRAVGSTSGASIDHYLAAESLDDLMQRVLERLEGQHGIDVVRQVLSLIAISRSGLAREELEQMTKHKRSKIDAFVASLEYYLIERDGVLTLFHEQFRRAIEARYVTSSQRERTLRRRIADACAQMPAADRKAVEMPWQLWRLNDWSLLSSCISDVELFIVLVERGDIVQLLAYWSELRERFDVGDALSLNAIASDVPGRDQRTVARILDRIGMFLSDVGQVQRATPLIRRAFEIRRAILGDDDPELVKGINSLAVQSMRIGSFVEAENLLREIIAHLDARSIQSSIYSDSLGNLATLLYEKREFVEARSMCVKALELAEAASDARAVLRHRGLLASIEWNLGQHDRAAVLFEDVLRMSKQLLGDRHPDTIEIVHNLGAIEVARGEHALAEEHFTNALETWRELYGGVHQLTAAALVNLGFVLQARGHVDKAIHVLEEAIAIDQTLVGANHPSTLTKYVNLANAYCEVKRFDEAERIQRDILRARLELNGPDHIEVVQAQLDIGLTLFRSGRLREAYELYKVYLPKKGRELGLDDPRTKRSIALLKEIASQANIDLVSERELKQFAV